VVLIYRSPYRDSGGENLLWSGRLSKLTDRAMYRRNQVWQLVRSEPVMPHIANDDFRRQMWIDRFGIHETTSLAFLQLSYTEIKSGLKMSLEHYS